MLKNLSKLKFVVLIAVLVLVALGVWIKLATAKSPSLTVEFYDVGQGDSTFIRTAGNYKILVDGGPNNKVVSYLDSELGFDRTIDLVVLTHPQLDHMYGLIQVLKLFDVKRLVTSNVAAETAVYRLWLDTLKKTKTPVTFISAGDKISLSDGTELNIVWPAEKEPKVADLNAACVVIHLSYGQFDLLLTGDADVPNQPYTSFNQPIEVLKVPHHGSKTAIKQDYLEILSPEVSVIMVGKGNRYSHPRPELLNQLNSINTKVYRTDQNGTVKIVSDGEKWYTQTTR